MNPSPSKLRRHIVIALAQGMTTSEVIADVREVFGVEVSKQLVVRNNPSRASGAHLSKELRELFETVRAKTVEDLEALPMAYRATRILALQRLHAESVEQRDRKNALKALDQIRVEMDGLELIDIDPPKQGDDSW
ncbi:DUF2280 domain-containing protein [Paraburkholderia sp. UYCP14C]|uniref:DUF2280 domain-containing protein n=1 Tax=Paraburkholderia sp. UYCP14C TaxID=2511130 RepID=UPI0010227F58|nr:DUF2280 domain-containing protein [Paraburkholderia sp. UYCP14C]RZF29960.1 DUF2280 domain-containing protein [Paraburkholderia sp. UYCP14C]